MVATSEVQGGAGRRGPSEAELLARLESWSAGQATPPSLSDVIESGDGQLLAAYILRAFRAAAASAVAKRLERDAAVYFENSKLGAAAFRVFLGIADAWRLSPQERLQLLGLMNEAQSASLAQLPSSMLPAEILERVAVLMDIFLAINTLLPVPERADAWMRKPNKASLFGGRSAIEFVLERDLAGMRELRSYLSSQVAGP